MFNGSFSKTPYLIQHNHIQSTTQSTTMKLFGLHLYKRRLQAPLKIRLKRLFELGLKTLIMLAKPAVPTALTTLFWTKVIYNKGWCFEHHMENIAVAAWIPTFGLLYCLLVAVVFTSVWSEYKKIRMAVKRYDVETFVDLKDEQVSPLIYTLVGVCSACILLGFMSLQYANAHNGGIVVASTAYVLFLVFFVVREMDDPTGGIWFIKHLPPEWLRIDVRKWRENRSLLPRENAVKSIQQFTIVEFRDPYPPQIGVKTYDIH